MGFSEWSRNVFSGNSFEEEKPDYHTITTDHPWMIQIGLGAFTTGVLQKWWDEKDQNGAYKNRPLFGTGTAGDRPKFIMTPGGPNGPTPRGHHFDAWRQNERNYIEYNKVSEGSTNWKFAKIENGAPVQDYNWNHLGFGGFANTLYTKVDASDDPTSTAVVGHTNIDTSICNIIEINNYVRLKKTYTPDETTWDNINRARAEFIRDIKSAKNGGGVTWSGYLPFVFNINDATNCTKWDWVKFNLQLFDNNRPKQSARPLGVSDFNIVGTPIDVLGQSYANRSKVDGEFDAASINGDVGSQVAGGVDMSYNEYTGKWQSGTPQIIARLTTDIPSAANESNVEPTVGGLQGATIKDLLDKNNAAYHHAQTGEAMPISMQNGNPLQWAPQYAESKGCRQNENKKTVTVVNLAPRSWASGQMVVLNKIDGVWFPLEFGAAKDIAIPSVFEGKWDFTYLLSNARYHMSKDATGESFHYDDYERLYYKSYYSTGGNNPQENVSDFTVLASSEEGYLQITSWDFMGPNLGGNSPKNNIGATVFDINVNGEPIGENADGKRARTKASAPFFGCTFPGGYEGGSIYSAYNTAGHAALSTTLDNTDPAPFFKSVDAKKIVFDNSTNNNNSDSYAGNNMGMFARNSSSLVHFPADMAVNASPNGENGRPISDIRRIYQFIKPDGSAVANAFTYFDKDSSDNPLRYAWMYKDSNPLDSAWDLAPKNKNIIEFRPLTRDVFNCFEDENDPVRNLYSNKAREILIDKSNPPMSRDVLKRTKTGGATTLATTDGKRLRYGPQDMEGGGYYTENQRYKPAPHPIDGYGTTNKPGGAAIGIITAICTTTAPSKIVFNTQTYIGVQTHLPNDDPAHGGSQRPQDFGCTALHARIFSSWPRELTVYDSRFFSVFHFNYGAGVATTGDFWHFNGSLVANQNSVPNPPAVDYPSQFYKVDESYSNVDYRIPTWTDGNDPIKGIVKDNDPILGGTKIVKNSKLRQAKDWRIYGTAIVTDIAPANGAQRRGKLLPINGGFNYQKITIGIQVGDVFDVFSAAAPITAEAKDHDIMIVNPGANYAEDDTFKVSNANGSSVLLKALTDGNPGPITGFTIVDSPVTLANGTTLPSPQTGVDFQPADFLNADDVLDGTKKPSAKITAVEATGADFEGYFVRGIVRQSPILTDYGPNEVTEGAERLTPSPSSSDNFVIQPILDDLTETSIGTEGKSSDNKFDIYFFFHNDVTHHSYDDSLYHQFFQSRVRVEILQE